MSLRVGSTRTALFIYLGILVALGAGFVLGAKALGERGAYLAQGYMLTPALAALLTRALFHPHGFKDARLRPGPARNYLRFWLLSLGATALAYALYTALGAIEWDWSGESFLRRLSEQFAAAGQDMETSLPPGFTPRMMLWLMFFGGLTLFNILPGLITGFGEEFGHRGLMFTELYRISPLVGLIVGGLLWYVWHWPVMLFVPQPKDQTSAELALNFLILAMGSLCTFAYLAYTYVKSGSVWAAAFAHIVLNNSAHALSYFAVVKSQLLANLGLTLAMGVVVLVLWRRGELRVFGELSAGPP